MAVHGALLAPADSTRPRSGFLVSVRGTTLHVPRLDGIDADLDIEAVCISSSGEHILYHFSLHAAGRLLIDGRAAVVVNADSMMPALPSGDTP
jgi:predicted hotdog family 3-hydroxylacyl-ACP dehydratase